MLSLFRLVASLPLIIIVFISCCHRAPKPKITAKDIFFSSSFFYWIVFAILFFSIVSMTILSTNWNSTPSPGAVSDPSTVFSEATLLRYYFSNLTVSADITTALEALVKAAYEQSSISELHVYTLNIPESTTFTKQKHSFSYMYPPSGNSRIYAIMNQNGINTHPLLFHSSLSHSNSQVHRGGSAGIDGWSIMLELMTVILQTDNPTHHLQHPVLFFFDTTGPTNGFADLVNFMKWNHEFEFLFIYTSSTIFHYFPL